MDGSLPATTSAPPEGTEVWVELLKTLADPIRLRILRLLEQQVHHGLSVGELAEILKLPQSTVSRHLKTLIEAGFTSVRREGTSMLYRLSEEAQQNSIRRLRDLARHYLDHDPLARTDAQRLDHILRQRQDATQKFFGKAAPLWDQIRREWFGDTFHLEAMLALLNPTWTVGDLGTGTGAMLPLVAPHVARVFAIDPSPAMLKAARTRVKDLRLDNVEILQGTLEAIPLAAATLDVALATLVLHHIPDPPAALKEIRRTLKPGGLLLIVDLQPHQVELFHEKMEHRWMGFSQDQLNVWLRKAGFMATRWHALPAQSARAKDSGTPVPDLFVLRAEAAG